jgi:hypothetical protein
MVLKDSLLGHRVNPRWRNEYQKQGFFLESTNTITKKAKSREKLKTNKQKHSAALLEGILIIGNNRVFRNQTWMVLPKNPAQNHS